MDPLRERALELARGKPLHPNEIERVARETSPESARWAFAQWELRRRARAKFADAERMLFVAEALEQATHETVAEYHASRFPKGARVIDLTCGIGADLRALAARGPALGFDLDPQRAACARHNAPAAQVVVGDCLAQPSWGEFAFADPSRRKEGFRMIDPSQYQPDPIEIVRRMKTLRLGGLKLSPLVSDSFLESLGGEVEFVSFGGECREATVWLGSEAKPGWHALHLPSGARLPRGGTPMQAFEADQWLWDADPAAIRAHALGPLAERLAARRLGDSPGYLTGPTWLDPGPWARSYRVLWHGAWDLRALAAALRALDAHVFEVKKRGVEDPEERLRKGLPRGRRPLSLVCWREGAKLRAALAEPPPTAVPK
jgi:hypothetical protein